MASKPQFRCPKTGKEFYFTQYITGFGADGTFYKDRWGKILVNPENGEVLEYINRKVDFSNANIMIGTGSGKSGVAKRNEQLAKRSKEHYKKEISEQKYEKNKTLIKNFKEGK